MGSYQESPCFSTVHERPWVFKYPSSHGENTGSSPVGVTTVEVDDMVLFFLSLARENLADLRLFSELVRAPVYTEIFLTAG